MHISNAVRTGVAVSWLMASAIAAFRPGDTAARYVLLSGAGMLACAPFGPIYTSRELGLPTDAFYFINGTNFLGGTLFAAFQRFDYDYVFAIVLSIIALIMVGEVMQIWIKKVFRQ